MLCNKTVVGFTKFTSYEMCLVISQGVCDALCRKLVTGQFSAVLKGKHHETDEDLGYGACLVSGRFKKQAACEQGKLGYSNTAFSSNLVVSHNIMT